MKITVLTPSRLHFGILDLQGVSGRRYGSLGLAISNPGHQIEAVPSNRLTVAGDNAARAREMARKASKILRASGCRIEIKRSIPSHVGLGSGTQLALGITAALAGISGVEHKPEEVAPLMGRGSISGIGLAAFAKGGFIVDGGHPSERVRDGSFRLATPPIVFQHPFPDNWFIVVAIPNTRRRIYGETERKKFRRIRAQGGEQVGRICQTLVMEMLPSLLEHDIVTFGKALTSIQRLVGSVFRPVQGGIYSSPVIETCVRHMLKMGAYGAGQSSWGPTVYGLVEGEAEAEKLKDSVDKMLRRSVGGSTFITTASNRGAVTRQE